MDESNNVGQVGTPTNKVSILQEVLGDQEKALNTLEIMIDRLSIRTEKIREEKQKDLTDDCDEKRGERPYKLIHEIQDNTGRIFEQRNRIEVIINELVI